MIYKTFDEDREYLVNKFRKPVFDPSTGMDDDEIRDTMLAFAQPMIDAGLPKPIIKARCFERACRELRIDLNPHVGLTGLISLLPEGLSRVFSNTTV